MTTNWLLWTNILERKTDSQLAVAQITIKIVYLKHKEVDKTRKQKKM